MLNGKVGLAPMADYSDYPFRKICSKFGAEFTFTEMISSEGIVRNNSRTYEMLPQDDEKNIGVQIFGSNIQVMVESARKVQQYGDWIDINAGCPVSKVVRRGAGSALLLDPDKLAHMIREIRKSVSKPLGVKVRIGYEKDNMQQIMESLKKVDLDYIIVHPRTREQLYSGKAYREILSYVRANTQVTLGASGDIFTRQDIEECFNKYKVDFVIVARGAIGNPWIFCDRIPSHDEIKTVLLEHLRMNISFYKIESMAVRMFAKFLVRYVNGMQGAREIRRHLNDLKSYSDVENLLTMLR